MGGFRDWTIWLLASKKVLTSKLASKLTNDHKTRDYDAPSLLVVMMRMMMMMMRKKVASNWLKIEYDIA